MPRFGCPHCQAAFRFDEEKRGTVVLCPECRKKIKLPAAAKPAAAPVGRTTAPPEEAPVSPPLVQRAKSRNGARQTPPPIPEVELEEVEVEEVKASPAGDAESDEGSPAPRKKKKRKKKKSGSSGNVVTGAFGTVGGLLLLAGFFLIITGKWVDLIWHPLQRFLEVQGVHPLIAIGATAGILFATVGVFVVLTTKSAILGAMPDEIDFKPTKPKAFENLDSDRLAEYTAAFEQLGFEPLQDYTAVMDTGCGIKGFARLFYSSKDRCFAEVNQAFNQDTPIPMRAMLCSFLDDGWSLTTTDRTPSKETYLMRRPRALWQSRPDDSAEALVAAHLKLRKKMSRDLEVEVLDNGAAATYFHHEKEATEERKQAVRGRWTIAIMLELWLFEKNPKMQWLGEYARKAKKK